eukprot:4664577-Prymnesium_polylepis.2
MGAPIGGTPVTTGSPATTATGTLALPLAADAVGAAAPATTTGTLAFPSAADAVGAAVACTATGTGLVERIEFSNV